ncbi:SOS response-associated peptidase family protein [Aliikangiella sp. IMCC44632]
MCGAIGRVTDSPFVKSLMQLLEINITEPSDMNIRPNAKLPIVIGSENGNASVKANWWLFQKRIEQGYTYDPRYKSFNTRRDKLFTNRKQDFLSRRCIIPASCFYEWKGHRYKIAAKDRAIAFGGLYKTWSLADGGIHYSCSIITLPPHPRFNHIHDKSFPLMLLEDEFEPWLDTRFHDLNYWSNALETSIRFDLQIEPVNKQQPEASIGPTELLSAD